ncbi:MAG: galactokinase [Candidatus Omnitrophica bacterium]|nr:galactokinase [Candidatus Omnitrophota bacterium]
MIITRTPFRVPLGGGGTDLPAYSSRHGGFVLGAAIDKYMYITLSRRPIDDRLWISYSKVEVVDAIGQIHHELVREALQLVGIARGIEIHSISEVVGGTGMGSSACFTVGLLNALHALSRKPATVKDLAEEAYHIEVERLGHPSGKQDQYLVAHGGLTCLHIDVNGQVRVEPLLLSTQTLEALQERLLMFYTGIERASAQILSDQSAGASRGDGEVVEQMHEIKRIGLASKEALERGEVDRFGALLDEHWQAKRRISARMSNGWIDECYTEARRLGVTGGKIIGAGGGGFFLFYCPGDKQPLRERLTQMGLREMPFRFDFSGTQVVANFS